MTIPPSTINPETDIERLSQQYNLPPWMAARIVINQIRKGEVPSHKASVEEAVADLEARYPQLPPYTPWP
jgi:hypothetical protein